MITASPLSIAMTVAISVLVDTSPRNEKIVTVDKPITVLLFVSYVSNDLISAVMIHCTEKQVGNEHNIMI